MQRVQGYGGTFALCGLRPSVKSIFEITRPAIPIECRSVVGGPPETARIS